MLAILSIAAAGGVAALTITGTVVLVRSIYRAIRRI
jgi:hypothetical protein